ncbi:hydantoinase/oxoprolinase family protein [Acidisoma cellulosilytica]|uniref:Hydantoinase/oxoprolinase family protein n=1 Tax=Acidisoma cellulosilyticum TaxID=2802395 RepID=A0A963Z6G7_9PROT|nr:hydantoinase/oxoprolinase family protein [Acidisoma cellulosilyticum]MCB8883717.1 hydantoinase/oxoprolinase family protein [Acidisoma cellulosilyticum]
MLNKVGVEIGGTFTDLVWAKPDGTVVTGKVPSTPEAIDQAVIDALTKAEVPLAEIAQFSHGSTIATNALLTRRGTKAGLLTTEGFRDVIEIGTHDRVGSIYNIFYRKPASPIPRRLIGEVSERMDAAGRVLKPLDLDHAWAGVERLLGEGVDAIAISLLHAYANPAHEQALAALIAERAPGIAVYASHVVSPEFREYQRSMTTVVSAFVGPVVGRYVESLANRLAAGGYTGVLGIMQSNGGMMPASAAGANAARMLLSGPAAGVRAAIWFARRNGLKDIITLDMGGTSTDVAIAPDLTPRMASELMVDGLPVRTPAVDMETVGAGGGSIAAIDGGGFLAVGPASAGALPGPACYDRGGDRPTVTDAQVIAGLLRPSRFFGGQMALRTDLAEAALNSLDLPGMTTAARADAVLRTVNGNMAAAVRLVSTARGIDPRGFALVAYGGGGPVHGALVADEVGIRQVLVPWSPGIGSAFGLLVADVVVDLVRTNLHRLDDRTMDEAAVATLLAECRQTAIANGLGESGYDVQLGLDLRYAGQAFELTIWSDGSPVDAATLRGRFEAEHRARYGYARPQLAVEAVNYRARVLRRNDAVITPPRPPEGEAKPEFGEISLAGRRVKAGFYARDAIGAGQVIAGPAVVEEATATTIVPDGWTCLCLDSGDLLLERLS